MFKRRRIQAEPQQTVPCNVAHLLFQQEVGFRSRAYLRKNLSEASLNALQLQAAVDTHDAQCTSGMALSYMQRRSPVLEVVVHGPLLFVLVNSGLCSVFNVEVSPARRLCYLNAGGHEVIRSIMLNSCDGSILCVSCHTTDATFPSSLHCRSVPADIRVFSGTSSTMYCSAGMSICDTVTHPGFVELDVEAHRALLLNSVTMQYKIYDLSTPSYSLLYCLPAGSITEVKMSYRYLLIAREAQTKQQQQAQQQQATAPDDQHQELQQRQCQRQQYEDQQQQQQQEQGHTDAATHSTAGRQQAPQLVLPLEVLSAVNGQVLSRHELPVHGGFKYFEVLELFDDMLLVKQPLAPFRIYNVLSLALCGMSNAESLSAVSSFMYLQQQHLFMTISHHVLTTWNFRAEVVAAFEDHYLWYPDSHGDPLVTVTADWVVSYCRPKGSHTRLPAAGAAGSIHISSVVTGRLLAKIEARQSAEEAADMQQLLLQPACQAELAADQTTRAALTDVTAVFYDDERHMLYTGNHAGMVHKWGPGG